MSVKTGRLVPRVLSQGVPRASFARAVSGWALEGLVVAAAAGVVMAFFLWIYRSKLLTVPIGWDTSRYLWRTTLAQGVGIAHMQEAVPSFVNADPARPAFPVIASTLQSLWGVTGFELAQVLPSVTAAAVGLAAGAFVAGTLGRSRWELALVAVAVGTSAFMARLLGPETYQDNLFAAAVFMAASIPVAMVVRHRVALVPGALLLGAGGVIHWAFFGFMLATLLITALVCLPGSWRAWRTQGSSPWDTPTARLASLGAGAAVIAAGTIYGVLGTTTRSPRLSEAEFSAKLGRDIPKYRFAFTLPVSVAGAAALFTEERARARREDERSHEPGGSFVLRYLLAWSAVALLGLIAFQVFGVFVPAHRFLAFALAVPVLAVLGIIAAGRLAARVAPSLGLLVVIGVVGASMYFSHVTWFRTEPWIRPNKTQQAASAAAYLEAAGVAPDRPIVFLLRDRDSSYVALMSHMIRSVLPAERISRTYFYAGSAEDYLARRPTPDETGLPGTLSSRYFAQMRGTYEEDPVALLLQFYNGAYYGSWVRDHPETVVAPHVSVVRGPLLPGALAAETGPVAPYSTRRLVLLSVGSLAVLGVTGLGWALALLGSWLRRVELVAVAPAVGIAMLVLGGILADRAGLRLVGATGAVVPLLVSAAGWIAFAWGRSRRARAGAEHPTRPR
ncbi:hypothetical protein BH20ACT24_BH20ACT24_09550 [soil metagenome]